MTMKKIMVIVSIVLLLFSFSACFNSTKDYKETVFELVLENQERLLRAIDTETYDKLIDETDILLVEPWEDSVIEFACMGAGMGSQTSYYGFYFNPTDEISGIWCVTDEKLMSAHGKGYLYKDEDGDNSYYTEKICNNFYYYEAHY